MATDIYRYEPSTGNAYLVSGDAEQLFEGDLSTLLGGNYTLQGNQLVDVNNAFNREQLGAGDITITRMGTSTGRTVVDVSSGIQAGSLNASTRRLASYSVTGDVTVLDESGNDYSIRVEASGITGYGQRLVVYTDAEGVQRFEAVTPGDNQEQTLRDMFGDTVSWATAEQYTEAALIGYIGRNEGALIKRIEAAGGMRDKYGQLQTTGSGIVRALAQIADGSVSYTKSVRINAMGEAASLYGP